MALAILVLVSFVALPLSYDLLSGGSFSSESSAPPLPRNVTARIRAIERQAISIRGLHPLHPVKVNLMRPKTFVAKISHLDQSGETPGALHIGKVESVLAGEIPASTNLKHIVDATLPSQVVGLYDHKSKQLYVKNNGHALGIDRYVLAHEFTHAMQDQHFNLNKLEPDQTHWKLHNSDEELAVRSLIEGDAVDVQYSYIARFYSEAERHALLEQEGNTQSTPAPRVIQEQFDFPYTDGPTYVSSLLAEGGYSAVNRAFRRPPTTTYRLMFPQSRVQVFHLRFRRVLGAFKSWHTVDDDVNGAFGYQQLVELYVRPNLADEMASLWRGDRYVLLHKRGQYAMLLKSQYAGTRKAALASLILRLSLKKRFGNLHDAGGGFWAGSGGTFAAVARNRSHVSLGFAHSRATVNRLVRSRVA